jgi:hypothetical protein
MIQNKNRDSNKKKFSMLCKISRFIPLVSNPGFGARYSGLLEKGDAPLIRQFGVEKAGGFFFFFFFFFLDHYPWSIGCHLQAGALEVVSLDDWLVSSISFFLSAGQVATGAWGSSLPVHARWSQIFFSPGGSCIALQLQVCLVSSSPSKVGQFRF